MHDNLSAIWVRAPPLSISIIGYKGSGAMVKPEERKECQKRHGALSTFIKQSLSIQLISKSFISKVK